MAENLSETGSRMGQQVGTVAEQARDVMSQAANRAKEYTSQGYEYAADKTRKAKGTAEHYIHENPWYAVGLGVGLGLLLGMLIRVRRSGD